MSLRRARALLLLGAAAAAACLVLLVPTALAAEPKAERWRDHTLNQAGPSCIAGFQRVVADNYQRGDPCVSSVQQAFAAVNKEACPSNMTFVQECMGKTSVEFLLLLFCGGWIVVVRERGRRASVGGRRRHPQA
jgi:hypothetical protein